MRMKKGKIFNKLGFLKEDKEAPCKYECKDKVEGFYSCSAYQAELVL